MDWTQLETALAACPVVPVLSIPRLEQAEPLARALNEAGITVSEITLRTEAGLGGISAFRSGCPDMLVGAGTILEITDINGAVDAGADFIVTPGFDQPLLNALRLSPVPVLPGVATAGEAMAARRAGMLRVKLFPAEAVGGAALLKGFAGPLPDVSFMPTGGVSHDNMADYLALPNVYGVGGTWIAKPEQIEAGDWDGIRARAEAARIRAAELRS